MVGPRWTDFTLCYGSPRNELVKKKKRKKITISQKCNFYEKKIWLVDKIDLFPCSTINIREDTVDSASRILTDSDRTA